MTKRTIRIFYLILVFALTISGQQLYKFNQEAENKFDAAVKDYENKNFLVSVSTFQNLVKLPFHQRTTAAYLMLAKNYLKLDEAKKAQNVLQELLQKYPESNYIDNSYYTLGISFIQQGNYQSAVGSFCDAIVTTNDTKIQNRSYLKLIWITTNKLDVKEIDNLIEKSNSKNNRNILNIFRANKLFVAGDVKRAKLLIESVYAEVKSTKLKSMVQSIRNKIYDGFTIKIGVLVPLMKNHPLSPFREIGEDVLNGIILAAEEFNKQAEDEFKIVLDVRDTERNVTKSTIETDDLVKQKEILAIVGPVFSNIAQAVASVAQKNKVPIITPTATGNGIAAIGKYVFQPNPDFESRGKAIANFAVKNLKLINLAVVAPNEPTVRSIVEKFIAETERVGGNVVSVEWYDKGSLDLREQFKNLRKLGCTSAVEPMVSFSSKVNANSRMRILAAGVKPRLLDSLIEAGGSIPVNKLFGKNGKRLADSLGLQLAYPNVQPDSLNQSVNSIHGILFPLTSADEIGMLTSQLNFYNINAQILGTSEWFDKNELDEHSRYTNNAIFISEFFINDNDEQIISFVTRYKKMFRKEPSRNSYFGYDTMLLLIDQIARGGLNRETLKTMLADVYKFKGLHSKIDLSRNRVNQEFHILKYTDGKIIKIGEINGADK